MHNMISITIYIIMYFSLRFMLLITIMNAISVEITTIISIELYIITGFHVTM